MEKDVDTQDLNMNELVNSLLKQLEAKDRQMEQLNQTIANLTETINELKRKIFGISSEKSSNVRGIDGQLSLFEQLGVDEPVQIPETIMDTCEATKNEHLMWFKRLLDNHFEGIIAHATYDISAGKIEGINNKIKTLRRQAYGYRDDEYFFLKLFDVSRKRYVRNPLSHKICD